MASYCFTAQAVDDLREIGRYTRKNWGLEQARHYRQEIELALEKLALRPQLGHSRDELSVGLRSHRVGSHIAFYLFKDNGLIVIRLLHPNQDIQLAFGER